MSTIGKEEMEANPSSSSIGGRREGSSEAEEDGGDAAVLAKTEHALPRLQGTPERSVLSAEFMEALERQAEAAAGQLALHISSLQANLNSDGPVADKSDKVTSLSVANMETFRLATDNTTTAVSSSVEQMHAFLTKCQQLNQDLPPIDDLARQIKELRRTLDQLEMLVLRFGRP